MTNDRPALSLRMLGSATPLEFGSSRFELKLSAAGGAPCAAAPPGDEALAPLAGERAPLPCEHGGGVELAGDHAQVCAQREPDPLERRRAGQRVERRVEGLRAGARHLPEEVFLRLDVVIEGRL